MGDQSSLVEGGVRRYGRFAARPDSVDPLDEYDGCLGRSAACG